MLSVGHNKVAAPKRFAPYRTGLHLHAEVHAVYGLGKEKTKGATIYLQGETAAGNLINSMPCSSCRIVLSEMGIKRIVYNNKGIYEEIK